MARARDLVGDRPELPPIERAPRDARLPLSFAQQGLWFVEQLGSLGATYHMPVRAGRDRGPARSAAHHLHGGGRHPQAADRAGGGEPLPTSSSTTCAGGRRRKPSSTG
jgi:hypothetical protein